MIEPGCAVLPGRRADRRAGVGRPGEVAQRRLLLLCALGRASVWWQVTVSGAGVDQFADALEELGEVAAAKRLEQVPVDEPVVADVGDE